MTVSGARRPVRAGGTAGRMSTADLGVAAALFALGLAYGTWAVYLIPCRLWNGVEGLSLVVTAVGNLGVGWLAVWGLGFARAALWPVAGWLVATGVMALVVGPGGDIVVPGGLLYDPGVPVVGELNWLAGLLSAGIALVLGAVTAGGGFIRRSRPPK